MKVLNSVKNIKEPTKQNIVLIITNDEEVIEDMELVFTLCIPETGFKIVGGFDDIIKHIKDLKPFCIVLDLNGDVINGCKMITKIRHASDSYLITIANPRGETVITKALDSGANIHIDKPIRKMEFIARSKAYIKKVNNIYLNRVQHSKRR